MFLSSLFVFLSIATAQPVADVPVQVTQHVSTIRYQFEYQENEHIIDLNVERKNFSVLHWQWIVKPFIIAFNTKRIIAICWQIQFGFVRNFWQL